MKATGGRGNGAFMLPVFVLACLLAVVGVATLGSGRQEEKASGVEPRRIQTISSPYLTLATGSCANSVTVTPSMTSKQYYAIVADIKALLAAQNQTCSGNVCPVATLAGCILRMAGHDFMDYMPNAATGQTGGPDGCVDFTDPDNGGLSQCLASGVNLGAVYSKYCTAVSLADFIVIAAEAVMLTRSQCNPIYYDSTLVPPNCSSTSCSDTAYGKAYTVPFCSNGTLDVKYMATQFRYGRVTQTQCSWANGRLPFPGNGCAANQQTFVTQMSLKWEEVTALMGVHTLGNAQINNSGYDGFWSDAVSQSYFNNDYYNSLLAKGWAPQLAVNGNSKKNQWTRVDSATSSTTQMMLDTDMCLVYDRLPANSTTSQPIFAANGSCCAWLLNTALTGCTRPQYNAAAPMQCWDEVLNASNTAVCGARGACCSTNSVKALPNCGSITAPMTDPAANHITSASGTFTTYDSVKLYAANSTRWYQDFLLVWAKVTTIGQAQLKCIDDLCTTTTTTVSKTATSATSTATTVTVTSTRAATSTTVTSTRAATSTTVTSTRAAASTTVSSSRGGHR